MSVVHFDQESFKAQVLSSTEPVLVDFWATWCGPCKMLGPIFEAAAADLEGEVLLGKVNVDEQMELAQAYNVMTIPTVILFKGGKEITRSVGLVSKQKLLELART